MPARGLLLTLVLLAAAARLPARDGVGKAEVETLRGRAEALKKAGKLPEAVALYEKLVAKAEQVHGPTASVTVERMIDLALLYHSMGRYAEAEPLYRRRLAISEAKPGKNHQDLAVSLNNLAELYRDMGTYARAEPLYLRSLKLKETHLGKDHLSVATSLNNLATMYVGMNQLDRAKSMYRRCLEIMEARLGKNHLHVAMALNNLAELYRRSRQFTKAEPLFRRSLKIREAALGENHPTVALALNNLATLYGSMGQAERAEPLLRRSFKIQATTVGKDHPNVTTTLINLALLYARLDRPHDAARVFDWTRKRIRRHLASVLPVLPDADKAAFFNNTLTRANLEIALSLGLAHKDDAALAERTAAWLLNGKALDQESLASSALLARQSTDPALGKLSAQLLALRQQLAHLTLAPPAGAAEQRQRRLDALAEQEQELAGRLRRAGSRAALPPWVEPAELRKELPAGSVLIDVARFMTFDFKGSPGERRQSVHYAAWVTGPAGPTRLIDLGDAGTIDRAVQQFREAMRQAPRDVAARGEEAAEKDVLRRLAMLSKLVLSPLLPHVGKSKRWLVSPDGNLWLVPFEALSLPDGKYAVERHEVRYLTSGRDVLAPGDAGVKPGAPLVLADPDFDLDPRRAKAETDRPRGATEHEEDGTRLPGGLRLGRVRRLAGTAEEAKAIAPSLKAYAGAPQVHLGAGALEGVVKAARSPRVLVLSTHGFFLPDLEVGRAKAAQKWHDPLLRCGLLLAGCNKASKAGDGDDGVLTGLEVVGTDLRGTELVVLSACETGLGEVQAGEGVAGLRLAFQLAGARSVVSTLWQVPDRASARLMTLFFQNLTRGQGKAEALRAAKLKLIEERRDDFAAAHPFFWAAFTLTGLP
jgi:CHAT domain-containing protein/tetratricopeptide (TPR) repeat protein